MQEKSKLLGKEDNVFESLYKLAENKKIKRKAIAEQFLKERCTFNPNINKKRK